MIQVLLLYVFRDPAGAGDPPDGMPNFDSSFSSTLFVYSSGLLGGPVQRGRIPGVRLGWGSVFSGCRNCQQPHIQEHRTSRAQERKGGSEQVCVLATCVLGQTQTPKAKGNAPACISAVPPLPFPRPPPHPPPFPLSLLLQPRGEVWRELLPKGDAAP